jgi:Protein kinase domain
MTTVVAPGTIVAAYRIDATVGRGGMGTVYEATQLSLQRTVALKLLSAELSDDADFRERFRREGLLQARLDHPHIIPVYEAGETEHGLFLAMRLVRGSNLKRLITAGELTPLRALHILDQVADALDTAHESGLIHRDIKPQNILVARRDHSYLADFGLMKSPDADSLTQSGQFFGTLNYMAPEQIRDQVSSKRSDVYSLGAVLYESLTGSVPFPRDSEAAVMYAHLQDPVPSVSEHRSDVTPALDRVVARALSKDPAQRQSSATALLDEARRALSGGVSADTLPAALAPAADRKEPAPTSATSVLEPAAVTQDRGDELATAPLARGARRPRRIPLAAIVLALLLAAAGGFLLGRLGGGDDASTRQLRAGALTIEVPSGWVSHRPRAGIPGMSFRQPVAASQGGARGGELVAGMVATGDPSMLGDLFLKTLERPLPAAERVRLGGLQGYHYADVRAKGVRDPLDLYVSPTTKGVATVACVRGPGSAASFRRDCGSAAASLGLVGALGFTLPPRRVYATQLDSIFDTLIARRDVLRDRLRYAGSLERQVTASADLSGLYKSTMRSLARMKLSPPEADLHDVLLAAMRATRDGYRRMTVAALAINRVEFRFGSRDARIGEAAINRALAQLARLGFRQPL